MGMWHISIPERRTHPPFFRYPLYRNSERNRSIRAAIQTPQRSLAIAPHQTSPAAPAIAVAIRTACTVYPHPVHISSAILQVILHATLPTQQKYNFVPFKRKK